MSVQIVTPERAQELMDELGEFRALKGDKRKLYSDLKKISEGEEPVEVNIPESKELEPAKQLESVSENPEAKLELPSLKLICHRLVKQIKDGDDRAILWRYADLNVVDEQLGAVLSNLMKDLRLGESKGLVHQEMMRLHLIAS